MEHLKLKAYSVSTLRSYRNEFLQLLKRLKHRPANTLTPDDLRRYRFLFWKKRKFRSTRRIAA
jgi:hypothetical protein